MGAGSAGFVLANRLTADVRSTVLLLDVGPRDKEFRVVDASIMPAVPSGNINAALIAVAEKDAERGVTARNASDSRPASPTTRRCRAPEARPALAISPQRSAP